MRTRDIVCSINNGIYDKVETRKKFENDFLLYIANQLTPFPEQTDQEYFAKSSQLGNRSGHVIYARYWSRRLFGDKITGQRISIVNKN